MQSKSTNPKTKELENVVWLRGVVKRSWRTATFETQSSNRKFNEMDFLRCVFFLLNQCNSAPENICCNCKTLYGPVQKEISTFSLLPIPEPDQQCECALGCQELSGIHHLVPQGPVYSEAVINVGCKQRTSTSVFLHLFHCLCISFATC
ncbi:hypothetical protein XENOCAPTIV_030459 [Xenoophorus captivus]|uniref:Uncharacterized protein n=1 Tax=Xenoophorus captivus TaxID=1517983 RepID=A0ABV0QYN5_9TELE